MILPHMGHLAIFGDIFVVTARGYGTIVTQCIETCDAAKYPTRHRAVLHNRELSGPRCQQCQGLETLAVCGNLHFFF